MKPPARRLVAWFPYRVMHVRYRSKGTSKVDHPCYFAVISVLLKPNSLTTLRRDLKFFATDPTDTVVNPR